MGVLHMPTAAGHHPLKSCPRHEATPQIILKSVTFTMTTDSPSRAPPLLIRGQRVRRLFTPFDARADIILDPCRSPHGGRLKDPITRGRAHGPSACPRLGPSISA